MPASWKRDCITYLSLVAQTVKSLPAGRETRVWSLCWEDALEKEMATHSSILDWRIPWTEEPRRLQSMGSQESDMTDQLSTHTHMYFLSLLSCFNGRKKECHRLANIKYLWQIANHKIFVLWPFIEKDHWPLFFWKLISEKVHSLLVRWWPEGGGMKKSHGKKEAERVCAGEIGAFN